MFAITGAAGKVGFATCFALRQQNLPVTAIVRDPAKADRLREIGCKIAVADLHNANALAEAIAGADIVQAIIPPSPQASDGAQVMRDAIESLATALEQTNPNRLLAISDYGAHINHDIGMPTMCRAFEQRLGSIPSHKIILRSAEHIENWSQGFPVAIASGNLASFHDPVDMKFPTISASDLGTIAADLLLRPIENNELEIVHAEGPFRYSANDVATALSRLSGRSINAVPVPRSQWSEILERAMSPSLAVLLIKANDAQNEGGLVDLERHVGDVHYGTTPLINVLQAMLH